jgi:hypothetical protein
VILGKPGDRQEWIFLPEDNANRNGLWAMGDPDRQDTELDKLQEPKEVEPEQYHEQNDHDTGIILRDMTPAQAQRYQKAEGNYDRTLP